MRYRSLNLLQTGSHAGNLWPHMSTAKISCPLLCCKEAHILRLHAAHTVCAIYLHNNILYPSLSSSSFSPSPGLEQVYLDHHFLLSTFPPPQKSVYVPSNRNSRVIVRCGWITGSFHCTGWWHDKETLAVRVDKGLESRVCAPNALLLLLLLSRRRIRKNNKAGVNLLQRKAKVFPHPHPLKRSPQGQTK